MPDGHPFFMGVAKGITGVLLKYQSARPDTLYDTLFLFWESDTYMY